MAIQTITTKELRTNLPKIKQAVDQGQSFVLIYRSRPFAQLSPLAKQAMPKNRTIDISTLPAVGMWKTRIKRASGTKAFLEQLRQQAWAR
ncbi:MAG: hypothetical protein HYV33_04550 [Candidatus Kerfeldbacteria bacterium]|nr:hypothetical protein [Candidatus Kerfeldbacteria bacterium]